MRILNAFLLSLIVMFPAVAASPLLKEPVHADPGPSESLEEIVVLTQEYVEDFDPNDDPHELWERTNGFLNDLGTINTIFCMTFRTGIGITVPPKIDQRSVDAEVVGFGWTGKRILLQNMSIGVWEITTNTKTSQGCTISESNIPIIEVPPWRLD